MKMANRCIHGRKLAMNCNQDQIRIFNCFMLNARFNILKFVQCQVCFKKLATAILLIIID